MGLNDRDYIKADRASSGKKHARAPVKNRIQFFLWRMLKLLGLAGKSNPKKEDGS